MAKDIRARRYARAAFNMAVDTKDFSKRLSDLRKIANLTKDEAVFALLEDHQVSFNDKVKLLSKRLGNINSMVLKLVSLLVDRGRLVIIGDIADEYQLLLDNYRGVEGARIVEVTTAIPLEDEDRLRITQRLTDMHNEPIILKYEVDSGLIGGIVVRIGDKLIDGSISNKLAELRKDLSEIGR